jgi:hypothetical protein
VTFELEPDVGGAFGYSPPARFRFDDLQPTAAEGVASQNPGGIEEAKSFSYFVRRLESVATVGRRRRVRDLWCALMVMIRGCAQVTATRRIGLIACEVHGWTPSAAPPRRRGYLILGESEAHPIWSGRRAFPTHVLLLDET